MSYSLSYLIINKSTLIKCAYINAKLLSNVIYIYILYMFKIKLKKVQRKINCILNKKKLTSVYFMLMLIHNVIQQTFNR